MEVNLNYPHKIFNKRYQKIVDTQLAAAGQHWEGRTSPKSHTQDTVLLQLHVSSPPGNSLDTRWLSSNTSVLRAQILRRHSSHIRPTKGSPTCPERVEETVLR